MDDDAVIARVLTGDVEAFGSLVHAYERALFAIVRSHGLSAEAEDLAQEVFLSAYRALPTYDGRRGGFSTWLYAIARNRCRDQLRRRRPALGLAVEGPSTPASVPRESRESHERLEQALAALPAERRMAFLLVEVHGLSVSEAAQIEGVAVGTIKSRLHRARGMLRTGLCVERELDG